MQCKGNIYWLLIFYYASPVAPSPKVFVSKARDGGPTGTTHGLWNPYDAHIPLVWFGWNVKQGKTNTETYMTDIAATLAAMLHIQMPSGCVGKVITEVVQ